MLPAVVAAEPGSDTVVVAAQNAAEAALVPGVRVVGASTLAEVLRGSARDARIHRILRRVTVVEIDKSVGRKAGELLGATGMSGQRCTVDALLAAVALAQRRPVILLTSDPDDLARLTQEPDRRRRERIAVIKL